METLLVGNTGYVSADFIKETFLKERVVVLGNKYLKTDKKNNITSLPLTVNEQQMTEIFRGYSFDRVVYFSWHLTMHGSCERELESLRRVLQSCHTFQVSQIVYLASLEGCFSQRTSKTVMASAAEQLCAYYIEERQLKIKIIRIPYLYSAAFEEDYLYQIISKLYWQQAISLPEAPEQLVYLLNMADLGQLLYRIFDGWDGMSEIINTPDCFAITFSQLKEAMGKMAGKAEISLQSQAPLQLIPADDKILRQRFGWFPRISILMDFPDVYAAYINKREPQITRYEKFRFKVKKYQKVFQLLELAGGWFLLELIIWLTRSMAQVQQVDLRLLFVVLMGIIYGMDLGIAAAALVTVTRVMEFHQTGMNWLTLFYEPTNWILFIAYFMAGAACGYIQLKYRDSLRAVRQENALTQDNYGFIQELYQDVLQDKQEYKKQIIGSRDSFGKIYQVTRSLDVARPQEVFIKSIQVMEDVLGNQSVSVYSIGRNKQYARLEAASRPILPTLPNSLRLCEYERARETLEQGEVWRNTELLPDYPMYMAGIADDSGMVLVIMIHKADDTQMSLYYANQVKILCGLIESSMIHALKYQESARPEQYLPGTVILKPPYFEEILKLRNTMQEQLYTNYVLVKLDYGRMSLEAANHAVMPVIRENDILGFAEDGVLYLILAQMGRESAEIVTNRLKDAGFLCEVVSSAEEVANGE